MIWVIDQKWLLTQPQPPQEIDIYNYYYHYEWSF